MALVKYHVNRHGAVERCKATSRRCPLGGDRHYFGAKSLNAAKYGKPFISSDVYEMIYEEAADTLVNSRNNEIRRLQAIVNGFDETDELLKLEASEDVRRDIQKIFERTELLGHPPKKLDYQIIVSDPKALSTLIVSRRLEVACSDSKIYSEQSYGLKAHDKWRIVGLEGEPPSIKTSWVAYDPDTKKTKEFLTVDSETGELRDHVGTNNVYNSTLEIFRNWEDKDAVAEKALELSSRICSIEDALQNKVNYVNFIENRPLPKPWDDEPAWDNENPVMRQLDYKTSTFNANNMEEMLEGWDLKNVTPDFSISIKEKKSSLDDFYTYDNCLDADKNLKQDGKEWELKRTQKATSPWSVEFKERTLTQESANAYNDLASLNNITHNKIMSTLEYMNILPDLKTKVVPIDENLQKEFVDFGYSENEAKTRADYASNLSFGVEEALKNHKERVSKRAKEATKRASEEADKNAHEELYDDIEKPNLLRRIFSF